MRHKKYSPQRRLNALFLLWCAFFILVALRLVQVQVLQHSHYAGIVTKKYFHKFKVQARRGSILDRHNNPIAVDLLYYSLGVNPDSIRNKKQLAQKLSGILGVRSQEILAKLRSGKSFVYLAHRLSPEVASRIKALHNRYLALEKRFNRYYPYQEAAAQLIGFCDFDNHARAGLEKYYDEYLHGKSGWRIYLRDNKGHLIPALDYPSLQPVDGFSLRTTLDMQYQTIVEEELEKGAKRWGAEWGCAILMQPTTGAILAMANYPTFNPNTYNKYPVTYFRNNAISYLVDPGSTFKIVAMAYALEQLNMNMDKEIVNCEHGSYRFRKVIFRDHKPFGWLTYRQVFEQSSNIGVVKLMQRARADIFYRYARDFGFGVKTGIDLPAEASGLLKKPQEFTPTSLYFMGIGYEVSVTALQVITAYTAVANGGKLLKPFVVKQILDPGGQVIKEFRPEVIRQVISPQTARYMTRILEGVVKQGTGRYAQIKGVRIAGKTGTAQLFDREKKSYVNNRHMAAFVGFFPVENPRFVLLVMYYNPRRGEYGGQVAAPVFRAIAIRLLGLTAVPQEFSFQNGIPASPYQVIPQSFSGQWPQPNDPYSTTLFRKALYNPGCYFFLPQSTGIKTVRQMRNEQTMGFRKTFRENSLSALNKKQYGLSPLPWQKYSENSGGPFLRMQKKSGAS